MWEKDQCLELKLQKNFGHTLKRIVYKIQRTKEICYFGEKVIAQRALELGLVNKVLPNDELMEYTREQALRLIPPKGPSLSIKLMKKTMHAYFREILSHTLDLENKALRKTFASKDFKEAMSALEEKRETKFVGK